MIASLARCLRALAYRVLNVGLKGREFLARALTADVRSKRQDFTFSLRQVGKRKFMVTQRWDDDFYGEAIKGTIVNIEGYRRAAESFAGPSPVIFDVGANIGLTALAFSAIAGSAVHAFEPLPRTFRYLEKNIQQNDARNVVAHNIGFDVESGTRIIAVPADGYGSQLARMSVVDSLSFSEEVSCNFETLDGFADRLKIERLDYIKIDTEGNDTNVLQGGIASILKFRPVIQIEIALPHNRKLYDLDLVLWVSEKLSASVFMLYKKKAVAVSDLRALLGGDVLQNDVLLVPEARLSP